MDSGTFFLKERLTIRTLRGAIFNQIRETLKRRSYVKKAESLYCVIQKSITTITANMA